MRGLSQTVDDRGRGTISRYSSLFWGAVVMEEGTSALEAGTHRVKSWFLHSQLCDFRQITLPL